MDKFTYPTSLNIGGVDYKIRTNYRAVLDLFTALNDSECFGETEEEVKSFLKKYYGEKAFFC